MSERNNLTETEYIIMEYLWSIDHDVTAGEIRNHFSQRNWSKQAVSTFLKRLVKSGYLKMTKVSPTKYYYTVLISKSEHDILPVREIVEKSFNGSYEALFSVLFNPNEKLSDDAISRIKKMISEFEDKN